MEKIIMFVDDERMVLDALRTQLREEFDGYQLEFCEGPEDALEAVKYFEEDNCVLTVVVSDWLMPNMKGDEFLAEMHKLYPSAAKIILTGMIDDKGLEKAQAEANIFKCLNKPWTKEELMTTISDAIKAQTV